MSCLASTGGVINPYDALRGFNGKCLSVCLSVTTLFLLDEPNGAPNFNNATTLVVTFLFEQYELELVKIWEEALENYLNTVDNKFTIINIESLRDN